MSSLPKDMQGSGILGTTAGEEVGLSGLPDRSSVVQLLDFGQSHLALPCMVILFARPHLALPCMVSLFAQPQIPRGS